MTKLADQMKADIAAVMGDLEDFKVVFVDSVGVRWLGTKDTVGIDPSLAIDGSMGGYVFSVWVNLSDHPSTTAAPAAGNTGTVDGTTYEVASTYAPDLWALRVDLRTLN